MTRAKNSCRVFRTMNVNIHYVAPLSQSNDGMTDIDVKTKLINKL